MALANGFVLVEPEKPFTVLVANFSSTQQWLVNQIIGSILQHPTSIIHIRVSVAKVLGILQPKKGEVNSVIDSVEYVVVGDTPRPSEESEASSREAASDVPDTIEELESLDLSHVSEPHHRKWRDMLREFTSMWDGSLGKIWIPEHCIDLLPGTRPIAQHSYQAGPTTR